MPPRISLCMIVKNEAEALPRSLGAARPWVDEIVVVDTGSTDATREIAAGHGARVVDWAWRDDFAAARNESLRHATGDWILVLDADETLAEGSGAALRATVDGAAADVVGFLVKIVCPREGDGGMVRLNWFPRLFRNVPGVRFEGVIHEQVIESLAGRGRIDSAPIEALHGGYALSADAMARKSERNLRLLERQLREEPTYAPGWFQLAETYVLLNRLDEAVSAYQRCLRLLETSRLTLPPSVIAVALQNLGATLLAQGKREDGLVTLRTALETDPTLVPAHLHLGNAAMAAGEWSRAEAHFADALAATTRSPETAEYAITPWLVHFLRGCAQARQDKLDAAVASFEATLAARPDHPESLWLLALTAGNAGDWTRCLAALERLAAVGRDDFAIHAQTALALSRLGRHAEAAPAARRALAHQPGSEPMLLLAAESSALAGQPAEAVPLYEALLERVPGLVKPRLALASCYELTGEHDAMMATYRLAVEVAPDSPDVLFALGSACLRSGALAPADECLSAAIALAPDRLEYRIKRALGLLRGGRADDARVALDEILARWPDCSPARQARDLAARMAGALPAVAAG